MRAFKILPLLIALGVWACAEEPSAPTNAGVCWRMVEGFNGKPDFRPLVSGVENLESCAGRLEGLRLEQGRPLVGAYQGRYIYVTDEEISVANGPQAQRYRIFTPQQRAQIQAGYDALKKRRAAGE